MTKRAASLPRLYALIDDIAKQVPDDIAHEIENKIRESMGVPLLPDRAPE